MGAIDGVLAADKARTDVQIQTAVAAKIMKSQDNLAQDLISKLFASVGIRGQLDLRA